MNNINRQSAAKQILTKPIKGWEDKYTISINGDVYSIRSNKFLKPRLSLDGYERVCLCNGSIKREYRVHRLVAETFIDNPNNLPQVNHIDGNKLNNYLSNLEWCTPEYNIQHGKEKGLFIILYFNSLENNFNDDLSNLKKITLNKNCVINPNSWLATSNWIEKYFV